MDDEKTVLKNMGVDLENLDSGCCGMAGSFGFHKDKYDVSIQVGELVLVARRARASATTTLIVADGYSCREQIAQTTDRQGSAYSRSDSYGNARIPLRDTAKGAG